MLMAIFAVVWILILAGTIIIFEFIVPLRVVQNLLNGFVQAGFTLLLVMVWLGIFLRMRNHMVKRQFLSEENGS